MKWLMDKMQRYPIIEAMLGIATIIGLYKIKASIPTAHEKYSVAVLYITFIVIAYYTVVQWKLKNLTSKQLTLNIRPMIVCEISGHIGRIKNIGNGVSMYIRVDEIPIKEEQYQTCNVPTKAKTIFIEKITCLEARSDWYTLNIYLLDKDRNQVQCIGGTLEWLLASINALTIYYDDIDGMNYSTEMIKERANLKLSRFC